MIGESITHRGLDNFLQKIARVAGSVPLNPESFGHLSTTAKPSMHPVLPKYLTEATTANLPKQPGNIARMSDFVTRQYAKHPEFLHGMQEAIQDLSHSPYLVSAATPGQALLGAATTAAAGGVSGALGAATSPRLRAAGTVLKGLTKLAAPRHPHVRIGSGI